MSPKKQQQPSRKHNFQSTSQAQMKRMNPAQVMGSFHDEDEDDDALEMERNFALLSKQVEKTEKPEEDEEEESGEESDEGVEDDDDDEDNYSEDGRVESMDTPGAEESHDQTTDSSLHTGTEFNQDLSTMSFEEIIKLQNKLGTKACNKLIHAARKKKQRPEPAMRMSKNRPDEISAKRPVPFLRKTGSVKQSTLRDPRFDDLSGEFKPAVFSQTYKFVNDIREKEAEIVKKKLKKVKSNTKKEELKAFLKRMENQKRNHQRQEQQRQKDLSYKRKQRALVGDGHRPFYLKKSDQKKLQLAEKYSELKKSGKLENFLSKKRKRNAVKDRRKMP
ncbi:ribosomal RNA processing protein 36 homolog [Clarias gariepinus]|uniref:ribosomal RNA processing protein 36 homolog n=1 Tax=Clarias gariepinus TaxID=13013 RepID=UPI00234C278F|nr:ribosomal RNA processing protein 36 homolog [Clarias gariepinus]